MKNIKQYITFVCASLLLAGSMASCIEETFPEGGTITEEQVQKNPTSAESFLQGVPSYFSRLWSDYHFAFGYGSMMHIRDQYTQDLCELGNTSSYNWWTDWAENKYQGDGYIYSQYVWNYHYGFIRTVNNLIETLPTDHKKFTDTQKGYYGIACAYRALLYLDLARMLEYLPCDATEGKDPTTGNDIVFLTVPIVKEFISQEQARNNPRVSHPEMAKFIEADLDSAIANIGYAEYKDATQPNLACVYGLKARLAMWNAGVYEDAQKHPDTRVQIPSEYANQYAEAAKFARMAIEESGLSPMDQNDWTSETEGFNKLEKWMWGANQTKETSTVMTGIVNWTSWLSNQTIYGYTGPGTGMYVGMDKNMYERVSDQDFRKYVFVAPKGTNLRTKNKVPKYISINGFEDYSSLKFRPNEGNVFDHLVGAAAAYPIMRVEEMYFIEAEALAHNNVTEGFNKLKDFMVKNRNGAYLFIASGDKDRVIDEIVFQKRVELWGEGQTFYDIKRLDYSVQRGYSGTNHGELERFNTKGRPAWMNVVMILTESNNNSAVKGWNNPDPSDTYKLWTE